MNVPDDGYSRNALCVLNDISTFVLLSLSCVDASAGGQLVSEGIAPQ